MRQRRPCAPVWVGVVALWCALMPAAGAKVAVEHAVLISVDGLRADAVTEEPAPNLRALMRRGAWAKKARCTLPSITIPNHVSMLTGLLPERHGFLLNRSEDYAAGVYVPGTIVEIAHAAGRTVGFYASKEKLRVLARPAAVDRQVLTQTGTSEAVVEAFVKDLAASPSGGWDLTVVHLTDPDTAGHVHGWMSRPYREAVRTVDRHIGRMVEALEQRQVFESTLVLITSDHGGIGRNHWWHVPSVLSVPWIAVGPPALAGGTMVQRAVGPCDAAPTILSALGLAVPDHLDGAAVF